MQFTADQIDITVKVGIQMHTFIESNYNIKDHYQRQGRDCLFDPIRKILIPATPEEYIRQKILIWLVGDLKVPEELISVEDNLCHYKKGAHGRADIIIKAPKGKILLLIESKGPNVSLTNDIVEQQLYRYADIINPRYVMLSNGIDSIYQINREGKFYDLKGLNSFKEMLNEQNLKYSLNIFEIEKPLYNRKRKMLLPYRHNHGIVSRYMPNNIANFTANLYNCIVNESEKMPLITTKHFTVISDGGLRYSSFGNASGGKWDLYYRYFIINDKNKNNQLVSLTIATTDDLKNDPTWGNQKQQSYLCIAIDDYNVKHLSLELSLDKYCEQQGDNFKVWHDGRMTVGNMGPMKSASVIQYMKKNYPELIQENKVVLGTLNNKKLIHITETSTIEFITNCITYAIGRDQLRLIFKSNKQNRNNLSTHL